jgi:hypothetical protein
MPQPIATDRPLAATSKLRELLDLLADLRAIREPLTTPEGLRASLELLLRLAEFTGIDRTWTDRVRSVLDDPRAFDVVLAVVRYLHGLVAPDDVARLIAQRDAAANDAVAMTKLLTPDADVAAQAFIDWLPLVFELVALLRELRRLARE